MNDISQSLKVAKKLGIKVIFLDKIEADKRGIDDDLDYVDFDVAGQWLIGKKIFINRKLATNYTVFHEIGHVLNGYMCCREHCEYAAHGAAIALAKAFKIRLSPQSKRIVDCYAGRTKSCPVEEKNENKK